MNVNFTVHSPSKITIDGQDIIDVLQNDANLFRELVANKNRIDPAVSNYLEQVVTPFVPEIETSIKNGSVELYWKRNQESDGSYEEFVWLDCGDVEIFGAGGVGDDMRESDEQKMPNDAVDYFRSLAAFRCAGMRYLKSLNNMRLDEIEESSDEVLKILLKRLRSKAHHTKQGAIHSTISIVSQSQFDALNDKLIALVVAEQPNRNIISFKLTRKRLFKNFGVSTQLIVRAFDVYGKELKLIRNLLKLKLFDRDEEKLEYNEKIKQFIQSVVDRNPSKKPVKLTVFNGLRVTFNKGTHALRLSTNVINIRLTANVCNDALVWDFSRETGRKNDW
eukprot:CAMPEP_0202713456 /NCGR_PEP_ID=MMETSP1385-20130828/54337_1 /ASSEMBLY_ACC=CAM_ASM_000861 /TAXON_ID=933848 /ORGANISM="Elphidium margaritaceum" /LENGTH=333 /DNA_ID=CAMNT_0049373811 /DNA_START=91 /DNA_END=1092 /DNA_ORIENTATION=+